MCHCVGTKKSFPVTKTMLSLSLIHFSRMFNSMSKEGPSFPGRQPTVIWEKTSPMGAWMARSARLSMPVTDLLMSTSLRPP